ncbi:MAG: hypothetical protein GYA24_22170 [Candidatus Lokiarchaeota archaeon]|nr:hypothetical protein [Candidatus Lokiarchaeota archaeon]
MLTLLMAVVALLFFSVLIPNFLLPFPEVFGFYGVVTGLLSLLFTVLNAGTSDVVTRYVSEHSVDNPRKCLEYIRFFILFQMVSGLMQVTGIALFALYAMPQNLDYLKWIFIIYATVQYPGMLTVYQGCLNGFSRFDKTNQLSIIQLAIVQPGVLIACVLVCKEIGAVNPAYGEMMGALIGYVIGNYLDDFITFSISARMFKPVLEKIGYSIIDTLKPSVSREVIRNSLVFGTKIMGSGMLYELVAFIVNIMIISWIPQYGSILGIYGIAKSICDIGLIQLPMTPVLSEAYNHKKYAAYSYGISMQLKYIGLIPGFLFTEIGMLLPVVLHAIIGGNYAIAAYIIPVLLPIRMTAIWCRFLDQVQVGASKPNHFVATRVVEQVTRFVAHFVLLSPIMLPSILPSHVELNFLGGAAQPIPIFFIVYSFCDFPGMIAKMLFGFTLADRRILRPVGQRLRVPWWQMFGAMALVIVAMIGVNGSLVIVFNALREVDKLYGYVLAGLYLIFILFGAPFIMFFVYSLVGGWDDYGLGIFKDAAVLSGPSKFLVDKLYKLSKWAHDRSPLKNRFPIMHEDASREIAELNELKRLTYERLANEMKEG